MYEPEALLQKPGCKRIGKELASPFRLKGQRAEYGG